MTPARVALAATLTIQIYTSFAGTAAAVLAPEIAAEFGLAPGLIGVFIGAVYGGAMLASLACGSLIERYGPIRVSQVCVVLCALGVAAVAAASSSMPALLALAAIVIGLGYGPITPASSQLLQRTASPARMALTFSIKQTGVPAGAALSGALLPGLALAAGWRHAFVTTALAGVAVVALAQPVRRRLDAEHSPRRPISIASIVAPLALLRNSPPLFRLALVSFAYSATQVCLTSYLVVFLTGSLGYTLISAGLALTVTTIAGAIGRIAWGAIADRLLAPRRVLALIGLTAAACALAMMMARPDWPVPLVIAVATGFGATAIGWNGVQLSEVARLAPPGAAGKVTSAASVVTFAGVVVGPPCFALLSSLTGDYRASFAALAVASGAGALALVSSEPHTMKA